MLDTPAGIYLHIPFCRQKCLYCDFYSVTDLGLKRAFLEALLREIGQAASSRIFDTIYFGGGTPSLLAPAEVGRVIEALFARFRFSEPVEITLEANPGTLTPGTLSGFRAIGVNRLNIGVQSFTPQSLAMLGRIHSAAEAEQAFSWARGAGFENIGIDMIYGLPGQGPRGWLAELARAVALQPEHIACYMLSVEPGTPLAERRRSGRFTPAPEAQVAELFLLTSEFLEDTGYLHYEISNFARRGPQGAPDARVSRHNAKYWSLAPYLGFGPAAHSFLPPQRRWNVKDTPGYIAALRAGLPPPGGGETLTAGQQMLEAVMLGLRTAAGIVFSQFRERFGIDFREAFGEAAAALAREGLLAVSEERCAPTRRGMLFHDTLVSALTSDLETPPG